MKTNIKKNQKRMEHNHLVMGKIKYKSWKDNIYLKTDSGITIKTRLDQDGEDGATVSHIYYYGDTEVMSVLSSRSLDGYFSVKLNKRSALYEKMCILSLDELYHKRVKNILNVTYDWFKNHDGGYYMSVDMIQKLHNYILKRNKKTFGSFSFLYKQSLEK